MKKCILVLRECCKAKWLDGELASVSQRCASLLAWQQPSQNVAPFLCTAFLLHAAPPQFDYSWGLSALLAGHVLLRRRWSTAGAPRRSRHPFPASARLLTSLRPGPACAQTTCGCADNFCLLSPYRPLASAFCRPASFLEQAKALEHAVAG